MSDHRPTLNAVQLRSLLTSIRVSANTMGAFNAYAADRCESIGATRFDLHALQAMAERIEAMAEAVDTGHVSEALVGASFPKAKESEHV